MAGSSLPRRLAGWLHPQLLVALVALVAVLEIGRLLYTVANRIGYPFELEWMEGGVVDHIRVVLAGDRLYRAPSLAFTPFIYPPVYYYLSAGVSRLIGVGFLAPRLVSTAALVGNLFLIARLVSRETERPLPAAVAAGLFAATYQLSGAWMDVARVDSLFLFFVLLGAYMARFGTSVTTAALSGLALVLAVFTKQTGLLLAPPVLLTALVVSPRRGLWSIGTFVAASGAAFALGTRITDGWLTYYLFDVPRQHDLYWGNWRGALVDAFWTPLVVPLTLGLLALAAILSSFATEAAARLTLYGGLLAATLVSSYSSFLHADGFANVLIPYHAVVSVCAGLGLATLPSRKLARAALAVALLLHFGTLHHDQTALVPTRADVDAGSAMIAALKENKGPLFVLGSGFYAAMAGHPEIHAHPMAILDVFKTHDAARKDELKASIVQAIQDKRFAGIVTDRSLDFLPAEIKRQLQASYRLERTLFPADTPATLPKTGLLTRPERLWVPR